MGLGRSRSCSWIVPIADVGAALLLPCESGQRGTAPVVRRPGPMKSSSFDEAAVEAGLALPSRDREERDRGRQRLVRDHPMAEQTRRVERSPGGPRSGAYRSEQR